MTETNEHAFVRNPHMALYPENIREQLFSDIEQSADSYVFGRNRDHMNDIALTYFGLPTTYSQLNRDIEEVAHALRGYGLNKGDYIALCLPNIKESVLYYYAIWRIGGIVVAIDPRTNANGIADRICMTGAKLLVTIVDILQNKLDTVLDKIPCQHIVVCTPADSLPLFGNLSTVAAHLIYSHKKHQSQVKTHPKYVWHRDFLRYYPYGGSVNAPYEPGQAAAVLFTSGTSSDGVIKGCVHTHAAFNAAFIQIKYRAETDHNGRKIMGRGLQRGDTYGGFIPFFAAFGAFNAMHFSLCRGMNLILIPIFKPLMFDKMIFKYKPTLSLGVPRFFEILANSKKLRKKSRRLAFIKETIIGGDKITPQSIRDINAVMKLSGVERGVRVGYGSTEFGGAVCCMEGYAADESNDVYDWQREGNVGLFLPACDALVIDPETKEELPLGVDGELCVAGYTMMKEYFGMPAETAEITFTAKDGRRYFLMGDKGHLEANGAFYYVDRYKRSMMRPDGHTVHPSPIENVIAQHPGVDSCAVVGLKKLGEETSAGVIPSAFIVVKSDMEIADIISFLKEVDKLCLRELPERDKALAYTVVDHLPYTLMGKVNFRELEKETLDTNRFTVTEFAFFPELAKK
ncbi:MAG: acyl--CoA ligase [Oscillospiraceae bacterium]|jgi:long-chain acyl-CoA synthetase|nr:acyl--CoA ligase [Oscillospiraceae bacterium]